MPFLENLGNIVERIALGLQKNEVVKQQIGTLI